MTVKNFEELEIWKEARRLTGEIYRLTSHPRFSKDFRLSGQIQGASVSIMSNIAEGFERGGNQGVSQAQRNEGRKIQRFESIQQIKPFEK